LPGSSSGREEPDYSAIRTDRRDPEKYCRLWLMKGVFSLLTQDLSKTLHSRLLAKDDSLVGQLFRYTIVGGVAFVVDFGTLILLTSVFQIHYLYSAAVAFLLGLATNYSLSVTWVFSQRSVSSRYVEFVIFAWTGIVGLALNELFMWLFTDLGNQHYAVSKLLATFLVFCWNFLSRKFILFRGER
jgi:putative flippase GtrA